MQNLRQMAVRLCPAFANFIISGIVHDSSVHLPQLRAQLLSPEGITAVKQCPANSHPPECRECRVQAAASLTLPVCDISS